MNPKISLSEINYNQWAVQMKLHLQQQGLWSVVAGRTTAENFECSNKWEDKRDQALATMLLDMHPRMQSKYIEYTDPVKLWAALETDLKEASTHSTHERRDGGRPARTPIAEPSGPPNPEVFVDFPEDVTGSIKRFDWILSSESTANFTFLKTLFKTYATYPEKKAVATTTGQMLEAAGYGEIQLRLHAPEGGEQKLITVSAYYVPTLKVNVLSPTQVGHAVELGDDKWTIQGEDGSTIATGPVIAGVHVVRTRERRQGGFGNRRGGGGYRRGAGAGRADRTGGEDYYGAASGGGTAADGGAPLATSSLAGGN